MAQDVILVDGSRRSLEPRLSRRAPWQAWAKYDYPTAQSLRHQAHETIDKDHQYRAASERAPLVIPRRAHHIPRGRSGGKLLHAECRIVGAAEGHWAVFFSIDGGQHPLSCTREFPAKPVLGIGLTTPNTMAVSGSPTVVSNDGRLGWHWILFW